RLADVSGDLLVVRLVRRRPAGLAGAAVVVLVVGRAVPGLPGTLIVVGALVAVGLLARLLDGVLRSLPGALGALPRVVQGVAHPFPNGFPDALAVALAIAALGDLPDLRGGVVALVVLGVAATTTLDGRTPRVAVAATAPLVRLVVGLVALAGLAPARLAPVVLAVVAVLVLHPLEFYVVIVVSSSTAIPYSGDILANTVARDH